MTLNSVRSVNGMSQTRELTKTLTRSVRRKEREQAPCWLLLIALLTWKSLETSRRARSFNCAGAGRLAAMRRCWLARVLAENVELLLDVEALHRVRDTRPKPKSIAYTFSFEQSQYLDRFQYECRHSVRQCAGVALTLQQAPVAPFNPRPMLQSLYDPNPTVPEPHAT